MMNGWSRMVLACGVFTCAVGNAQTANTGAVNGTVADQSQAVVPHANVRVISAATGEVRTAISTGAGTYVVPLLPPGAYRIEVNAAGFKTAVFSNVTVNVTENQSLNVTLAAGGAAEIVNVNASNQQLEFDTNTLGRTVDTTTVEGLPLVTRNFTQIVGLSAGVVQPVNNASALGRGAGSLSFTGGFNVNGARNYDNNFQLDGLDANDLFASGANSGGVPVPDPDAIEQFKVQTGQYDASFGRNAGANVDVVTKGGSNNFHGSLFEFFRNDDLNANDFFFNRAGTPRGKLKQNQFGGTIGGPVKRDKLLFFGSYQKTIQRNGVTTGCSSTFFGPPLTNDRSAAALGALFSGQTGAFGGTAVLASGSNINPVALNFLQAKLPNGQYYIPTPVSTSTARPFATQGQYAQRGVCQFNEDQYAGNADYIQNAKSKFQSRLFDAQSNTQLPFTGGSSLPNATVGKQSFVDYSLTHTYIFSERFVNEAAFGFHSIHSQQKISPPVTFSSVGATVPVQDDPYPALAITGFTSVSGTSLNIPSKYYEVRDNITYSRGRHTFRAGIVGQNAAIDFRNFSPSATELFLSFPDFLLGLHSGAAATGGNGTAFSNIFASVDLVGLLDRDFRVWNGSGYVTDEYKVSRNISLNLGLRYERMGDFYDALGRNATINPSAINLTPPATGAINGYVVPANYGGALPAGVTQLNNSYGIAGIGQNQFEPRVGFTWNLFPRTNNVVLRGGYGVYNSRLVGQQYLQLIAAPPFSQLRQPSSVNNGAATEQNPFAAVPAFPIFPAYSPTTALTPRILASNYRPAQVQQYSLNTQTLFPKDVLFEIGYVGTRSVDLIRDRSINQANLASAAAPIRGVTTNTVANVQSRVPYQGFSASGFQAVESEGASWYNSLQTTLNKRISNGSQVQAAYTFSRLLDTDGGNSVLTSGGNVVTVGNQNGQHSRYGRADANVEHRFVVSYVYQIPNPLRRKDGLGLLTGGWSVAGVTIIQSGQRLTLTGTNANNVYGITADRAPLAANATNQQVALPGTTRSKLTQFFNTAALSRTATGTPKYPIVGDDGVATAFGNSGVGIVAGPGQADYDASLIKTTKVGFLGDSGNIEFRSEFFNLFNHAQFANPDINLSDATFGQITATSVNPRIVQFALKLKF